MHITRKLYFPLLAVVPKFGWYRLVLQCSPQLVTNLMTWAKSTYTIRLCPPYFVARIFIAFCIAMRIFALSFLRRKKISLCMTDFHAQKDSQVSHTSRHLKTYSCLVHAVPVLLELIRLFLKWFRCTNHWRCVLSTFRQVFRSATFQIKI